MLYTRKGDGGTTKLFGSGGRISKTSLQTEALGSLDELTAVLGLCHAMVLEQGDAEFHVGGRGTTVSHTLRLIQQHVFIVQAEIAGAPKRLAKSNVTRLETVTDALEALLPPITTFSLPGACTLSAQLDVARTVARRTERVLVRLHESDQGPCRKNTLAYLNRLSSLLFALARYTNNVRGLDEVAPTY